MTNHPESVFTSPSAAYDQTLAWINDLRTKAELPTLAEMPAGDWCGNSCPIFSALEDTGITWVSRSCITKGFYEDELALPPFARAFIVHHDAESYPELIA